MRRSVASVFVVPAGVLVAALTVVHALRAARDAAAHALRPAIEDASEEPRAAPTASRRAGRSAPRRRAAEFRQSGTRELPRYGNPSGSGAGSTGFISTNPRRRPILRGNAAPADGPGPPGGRRRPLPLTAPGTSPTAPLTRSTVSGTSARSTDGDRASRRRAGDDPARPRRRPPQPRRAIRWCAFPTARRGRRRRHGEHHAADDRTAALLRRRTAVEEDPFAPLGGHAGAFLVLPAIEVTGGYDTNPARTPSGARVRRSFTVSPELLARSDWQRHEVTAALRGSYTAYDKTPDLDRPAVDGKVTGRIDVTRDTALDRRGHVLIVGTDNPGSPNVQAGLDALADLHDARRHVRPDAALQPRRGHRQGHGRAHRIPATRSSPTARPRATTTATTTTSAARCAPATT